VASALATGSMHYPFERFVPLDAAGATLWAVYSVLIGYVGGATFADEPEKGLLLSFGIGLALVTAIEFGRRLRLRGRRQGMMDDRAHR
jgi:membrane protein DedA with SNARE-associated domain